MVVVGQGLSKRMKLFKEDHAEKSALRNLVLIVIDLVHLEL